jgi:poly(3-hydroxyalkanoate) depolymerase
VYRGGVSSREQPGDVGGVDPARERQIRYVEVDGLRIRTCVRGEGHPLLLMMGIGGNIEMWEPFERALASSPIQTISFDAPGTGDSSGWLLPRRMGAIARLVEGVLDELGYDRVDVLGVSFGGALAQQFVRRSPRRVGRLVLAATAPGMPGLGGVPGSPRALWALATPRRYYSADYLRKVAPVVYGGRIRREPELFAQQSHARLLNPPSVRGYFAQMFAVQLWTNVPWLPRVRSPTLVMAGDDDPIIPPANGRILARLIPGSRLVIVPGGGHLFLIEQAEEAARHVIDFLHR